ncbi:MAG: recombinase family protein [Planctomycetes bacterium]|nr:recombinase family protein [Planctomycetota bacterium]
MPHYIAYYRVSIDRPGQSGLGLEAQEAAVHTFARQDNGSIIASYREVETGKQKDRPELRKAILHARRSKAVLLVTKLDRLARNVAFTSALMESGADFLAADNPHANKLTIHILAAVAEDEAHRISERTKAALQAYKRRGGKLGSRHPRCRSFADSDADRGQKAGSAANQLKAAMAYNDIHPLMAALRQQGDTLAAIADHLNQAGHTTRFGKEWSATQVKRVLDRGFAAHTEPREWPGGI